MPDTLYGRNADKWRPLISIADDFGYGYGEKARAAAVKLCSDRQYENPYVTATEGSADCLGQSLGAMEHSIDHAGRRRDRKFKPLVLGQIQAAGDNIECRIPEGEFPNLERPRRTRSDRARRKQVRSRSRHRPARRGGHSGRPILKIGVVRLHASNG
jgi:hypothetical protein